MRNKPILFVIILLIALISESCMKQRIKSQTDFINKFVKSVKFIPFELPRNKDGVGTINTFINGRERIEAPKNYCLSTLSFDTIDVVIPDYEFEFENENSVQAETAKLIDKNIDIKAAFKNKSIKKIKVTYVKPFILRIATTPARDLIKKSVKNPDYRSCAETMYKKGNFIIESVIGAQSIRFSLITDNNNEATLDAKILDEINASAETKNKFKGTTFLETSSAFYIGYNLWDIASESGIGDASNIELRQIPLRDIVKKLDPQYFK